MPIAALVATAAGCGDGSGSQQSQLVQPPGDEYFVDDDVLKVDLEQSPSDGGSFDFCTNPGGSTALELKNAAWLGFMAANEYAHLGYIAPALSTLGFGNDGAGDLLWVKCATDLRQVRAFERTHAEDVAAEFEKGPAAFKKYLSNWTTNNGFEETWGTCAVEWFDEHYDGRVYPAAAFEEYLIQTPHENQYIQFFSGGEFDFEGTRFKKGSTQVMFARHGELPVAIVSFRGTESDKWHDIAADAKATRVALTKHGYPEGWGKLHSGFFHAFDSVADDKLMAKIEQLKGTGVQIWLTGHSLGAALATVMASRLLRDMDAGADYNFAGVYTFGSPRVGNTDFHKAFEQSAAGHGVRMVRFRNGRDVVTTIPPALLFFQHVGHVTYLDEGALSYDTEPGFGLRVSVADHDMAGFDAEDKPVSGYYRRVKQHMNDPRFDAYNVCE